MRRQRTNLPPDRYCNPWTDNPEFDLATGRKVGFNPVRRAMLLVAGDKSGGSERRFYRTLIGKADERFDRHLARLEGE